MRELEVMRIGDVRTMFDYLYWARDRVLAAAAKLSDEAFLSSESVTSRDLRATLVHELDVEWSWRERLHPTPGIDSGDETELKPDDYPTLQGLVDHWERDEAEMRDWLSNLTDDDVSSQVSVERAGWSSTLGIPHPRDGAWSHRIERCRRAFESSGTACGLHHVPRLLGHQGASTRAMTKPTRSWDPNLYDQQHSFVWELAGEILSWLDPKPGREDSRPGLWHRTPHRANR